MNINEESLEAHKKYLAEVDPAVVAQRLEAFHLDMSVMKMPSIVCLSDIISGSERGGKYRQWLHLLEPRSLDDMKLWFGVPNEVAIAASKDAPIEPY